MIIIGTDCPPASGNTLLAHTLVNEMNSDQAMVMSADSYYNAYKELPIKERVKSNYAHPHAFDHSLLIQHLEQLQASKSMLIPQYGCPIPTLRINTTIVNHRSVMLL